MKLILSHVQFFHKVQYFMWPMWQKKTVIKHNISLNNHCRKSIQNFARTNTKTFLSRTWTNILYKDVLSAVTETIFRTSPFAEFEKHNTWWDQLMIRGKSIFLEYQQYPRSIRYMSGVCINFVYCAIVQKRKVIQSHFRHQDKYLNSNLLLYSKQFL